MEQTVITIAGAPCSGKTVFSTQLYLEFLLRGEASVELIQERAGALIRNGCPISNATCGGDDRQTYDEEVSKAEFLIVETPRWVRDFYLERTPMGSMYKLSTTEFRSKPVDVPIFLFLPTGPLVIDAEASHRDRMLDSYAVEEELLKLNPMADKTEKLPHDYALRESYISSLVDTLIQKRDRG